MWVPVSRIRAISVSESHTQWAATQSGPSSPAS